MSGSQTENLSSGSGARRVVVWVLSGLVAAAAITMLVVTGFREIPPTTPGAPHPVFAVPFGNGTAKVIWRRPPNGGSVITGYRVTPYRGPIALPPVLVDSTNTTVTISGLRNGEPHRFVVVARNAVGAGRSSPKTAELIIGTPGQPPRPTVTREAPGSLLVSSAAASNGGAPISSYAVTCISSNGGVTKTASRSAPRAVVGFLTPGTSYTCRVTATNGRGAGLTSQASTAINA
jgi:hypothetical protein